LCDGTEPAPMRVWRVPDRTLEPALPEASVDTHVHVFGNPGPSRPIVNRTYSPIPADLGAYRQVRAHLGGLRTVLVQPSVYGTDNRTLLKALVEGGDSLRGVAVSKDLKDRDRLRRWQSAGVRGIRLNLRQPGGIDVGDVLRQSSELRRLGWHVQAVCTTRQAEDLSRALSAQGVPLVLDHFALLRPDEAERLLRIMRSDSIWLKLSARYRLRGWADASELGRLVERLCDIAPDRLLWGSDWPHPDYAGDMPDELEETAWIRQAVGAAVHQVFVDNPARLYGWASGN